MTIDLDCTFPISLADLAIGSPQLLNLMNSLITFRTKLLVILRKMTSKMRLKRNWRVS